MAKVYRVENIVASISLRTFIPLKKLRRFPDTQYNPEQFPGLVFRIKSMHITFLVFGSGKLVCTGSRSRGAIDTALKILINKLKKVGVSIKEKPKIEVQNIVASGNLNKILDLNKIAYSVDNTEYNPEQFPGLVYKLADSRITFLLFGTGKIVCTGARRVSEIDEAIDALLNVVNAK